MSDFLLGDEIHTGGDPQCPMCVDDYPESCGCGGLMHASAQSDSEDEVVVATRCDACGRSEEDLAADVA